MLENAEAGVVGAGRIGTVLLRATGDGVGIVLDLRGLFGLLAARVQVGQTLDPGSKGPLVTGAL